MNQNFIYAELKERLYWGNTWYDSFQTLYLYFLIWYRGNKRL